MLNICIYLTRHYTLHNTGYQFNIFITSQFRGFLLNSTAKVALPAVALGVQVPVDLHSAAPILGCGAVLADGLVVAVVSAP